VLFKQLHQTIHFADDLPPSAVSDLVGLQLFKGTPEQVPDILPASFGTGKCTISDEHECRTRVVQDDLEVFDRLDGLLHFWHVGAAQQGDILPGLFDVWAFIYVQLRTKWPKLLPDFIHNVEIEFGIDVRQCPVEHIKLTRGSSIDQPWHTF